MNTPASPLVVIGMGRSGTSAISAALGTLGFYGGDESQLLPGDEGNPNGYFEIGPFATLNDQIRSHLGMLYNICLNCPDAWREYEYLDTDLEELISTLRTTFEGHRHWVLKDPRISLLLPIYLEAFRLMGLRPSFVICVRNPLNVADSFHRKFGASKSWVLGMWLQHTLAALKGTSGYSTQVVVYEQFLADPAQALQPVLSLFPDIQPTEAQRVLVSESASPGLNHGSHPDAEVVALRPSAIGHTYALCQRMVGRDPLDFSSEVRELIEEFEGWWNLPPYDRLIASRAKVTSTTGGTPWDANTLYVPRRCRQSVSVPVRADAGSYVECQVTDMPGIFLMERIRYQDDQGTEIPVAVERAADVLWNPHAKGELWTLPRSGNHFRFKAPTSQGILELTFSCIAEPPESVRFASQAWMENLALHQRVAELENAIRQLRRR